MGEKYKQTYKFCTVKETINKTRIQPIEWEKIFANDVTAGFNFQNIQTAHTIQHIHIKTHTTQSKNEQKN